MSKLMETGPSPRGWHRLQNMLECPQKYSYRYNLDMEASIPAGAIEYVCQGFRWLPKVACLPSSKIDQQLHP